VFFTAIAISYRIALRICIWQIYNLDRLTLSQYPHRFDCVCFSLCCSFKNMDITISHAINFCQLQLPSRFTKPYEFVVRVKPLLSHLFRCSCRAGIGSLLLAVRRNVSNHSVCQQHTYFYTSQGQYTFFVNHDEIDMWNMELLFPRTIRNCLACQVWHAACRRLPTPAVDQLLEWSVLLKHWP